MLNISILSDPLNFAKEFERCCHEYKSIYIATAWIGNPDDILPYTYLEKFKGEINVTIGTSFSHTHPDAIQFLCDLKADLRIFRDGPNLFHPKLYFFSAGPKVAIIIGSSNLTYSGFYDNIEVNTLMEGIPGPKEKNQLIELRKQMEKWHSDSFSFVPSLKWIESYRKDYQRQAKSVKIHGIKTPSLYEDEIASASWLKNADWDTYYKKVLDGLMRHDRGEEGYIEVLDIAQRELPVPWKIIYFDDLEKRRIIGGIGDYGWLGHVAASGQFRHLLAAGTMDDKQTMVRIINEISNLEPPINWNYLNDLLMQLIRLGPTMKVWGRLLCLVRPDLYCTISSTSVRTNLSKTLRVPQNSFEQPDGYIQLLRLIHSSPWFKTSKPSKIDDIKIWQRRVAFVDAIFY